MSPRADEEWKPRIPALIGPKTVERETVNAELCDVEAISGLEEVALDAKVRGAGLPTTTDLYLRAELETSTL